MRPASVSASRYASAPRKRVELVGPLTIELTQKMRIFLGFSLIRLSQLPLKLPHRSAVSLMQKW